MGLVMKTLEELAQEGESRGTIMMYKVEALRDYAHITDAQFSKTKAIETVPNAAFSVDEYENCTVDPAAMEAFLNENP